VAVRVPAEELEAALATFVDLAPQGFEEVDLGREVELAVFTDEEGEERVRGSFGSVSVTPVRPGWEDAWRAFHRPVRVGPLWIGPPWERRDPGALAVVIDPGRAFGTGAHPTTRLCLELLLELDAGSLVDVGCGSGVVALAAARLGFEPVTAVDVDPDAIEATVANARANGLAITAIRLDAESDPVPAADVAVANVALGSVERIVPRLAAGRVVTSGYLATDRPRIEGRRSTAFRELDGWRADLFER
jgi:ribosomal protein L11 methyltransferase